MTLTLYYPNVDDLWAENRFWNGISGFQETYSPAEVTSLPMLPLLIPVPENTTLLLVGPSTPYTGAEADAVHSYLTHGGRVLLADDFGEANTLLTRLNTSTRFSGSLLSDALYMNRHPNMPVTFSPANASQSIALNYATALVNVSGEVMAWSSPFSVLLDETNNTARLGPYPVLVEEKIGDGELVLIGDSSLFINGMTGETGASVERLVGGYSVFMDVSHHQPSRHTVLQGYLRGTSRWIVVWRLHYVAALAGAALILGDAGLELLQKIASYLRS